MTENRPPEVDVTSPHYIVPKEFETVSKGSIRNSAGLTFYEFRRTLRPKFFVVWTHIILAYVVLVFTALLIIRYGGSSLAGYLISIFGGAFLFGYTIAFILLFFHEAAHYNLAGQRGVNDILANIFVGAIVGQDINNYRPIHWGHHRFLGTTMDTEQSYFDPLDTKFIVQSLLGVKAFTVLSKREAKLKSDQSSAVSSMIGRQLVIGLLLNGLIVGLGIISGNYQMAAAWVGGMLIVFPFFAAVRQVLEHRDENARSDVDHHTVAHGVINRLFGDGIIADTLGGAGFNRHLLHHWDPQLSYTRLRDLEQYLMDTPLAAALASRQTTYFKTFVRLTTPEHAGR